MRFGGAGAVTRGWQPRNRNRINNVLLPPTS
ncbi:MAG: hypothetical protein V7644_2536 [Actinomycetota bacterium]